MISNPVICAFRSSVRCLRHMAVPKAPLEVSDFSGRRWFSTPNRGGVSGMEEILARVVAPLPTYETREKSPPPPDSNSLEFMHFYRSLEKEEKLGFLSKLSQDFGVDHKSASEFAGKLLDNQMRDLATILQVEDRLRHILTPRYKQMLNHISRVEGGVKFLVDLRADVLEIISNKTSESPHIRVMCVLTFSTGARMSQVVPFALEIKHVCRNAILIINIRCHIENQRLLNICKFHSWPPQRRITTAQAVPHHMVHISPQLECQWPLSQFGFNTLQRKQIDFAFLTK